MFISNSAQVHLRHADEGKVYDEGTWILGYIAK